MAENKESKNQNDLEKRENPEDKEKDSIESQDKNDEALEQMISEVENRLGIDRSQFKIVKYSKRPGWKSALIDILITVIINVILIMSITGFIPWTRNYGLIDLGLFAIFFSVVEQGIKYFMVLLLRKVLLKTMLLIMTLPTLLSIVITLVLNHTMELTSIVVTSVPSVLLMFFIFIVIRNMLKNLIKLRKRRV